MTGKYFLDTNFLVYCFSNDEPEKRQKCLNLLARGKGQVSFVISTQVLNEFAAVMIGKLRQPPIEVKAIIRDLALFEVVNMDVSHIQEAIDIIIEKRISGAPVLDDNGKLVGMLSEKDCLRIIVDQAYHNLPIESKKVSDYMTAEVKTVSPEHDVVSAANLFLHTPIRRMPVVENGVLKGQISRRDILRAAKNFKVTTW